MEEHPMFSPLNDPQMEQWFQRLNAPLKRLPAADRIELHEEVRQHLYALVAANRELGSSPQEAWEHALTQFGDPTRIGRHLAWEWRRGRGWVSAEMAVVLCGVGLHLAASAGLIALFCIVSFLDYFFSERILGRGAGWLMTAGYFVGVPVLTGLRLGCKYPRQALTGAFYALLALPVIPLLSAAGLSALQTPEEMWREAVVITGVSAGMLSLTCGAAYLASVTKRGWYRPSLADFKLTLPHKRLQINR
jgi:hypothetical protein